MNNASLELGGTNWAEKDGNILGYSVGDTSGNFSPQEFTFARGSNLSATRIDRAGLIVKGRENVLLQSNGFDTTWTKSNATLTSGQADKDGGTDAWLLTATNTFNRVVQSISQSGVKRFSVYAKANANDYLLLGSFEGAHFYATFNLATGAVDSNNINAISPSIEDVGNGWYRCSATWVGTTTEVRIGTQDASGQGAWASTTSGSIYIQDAQLEQGLAASPYIETTTTSAQAGVLENTPRLNYTTGVANPYLLLEPSRTNVVPYSEYIAAWQFVGSITRTSNYGVSPEGVQNSTRLQFSGASQETKLAVTSPTGCVASVYVKGTNNETIKFGSTGSEVLFTLNGSWQRLEKYNAGTPTNITINTYSGATARDIEVWGAQLEAGSYPTSYIPTYSVSATRAVDSCNKLDASGEINSTEGVLYTELSRFGEIGLTDYCAIGISDGTNNNQVIFKFRNYINTFYATVQSSNGSTRTDLNYTFSDLSATTKIAFKYKTNDFALWVNGVEVATSNNANSPIGLNKLNFASATDTEPFYGKVNALQVYKEALTDAELATLTTI